MPARVRRAALLIATLLIVAACSGSGQGGSALQPGAGEGRAASPGAGATAGGDTGGDGGGEDGAITMAASLPLTGMFSIPGTRHQAGYELCVDLLNEAGGLLGRPVELIVEDNRSDTEVVVNQYERFINVDDVDLLLGTFSTLLSFPSSTIAEQAQMVYPEPSDSSLMSHSRGYQYNFGFTLKPIDYIGQTPIDGLLAARDAGLIPEGEFPQTAAVLYQDDFFPNSIARGLVGGTLEVPGTDEQVDFSPGYLEENGIEVVAAEQFPADFNDWVSLANTIRASEADLLFALTVPPVEVDLVRAMQTVGYTPDAAFFSQGTYAEFAEQLGDAANGVMVWSTWDPTIEWEGVLAGEPFSNQDFVAAFEEANGSPPEEDHVQAFTVCQTMAQAVEATGTTDNTELRDWLASRTADDPARTIQGDYHWDDTGLTADRDVLLLQWQDGELRFVFPTGEAYPDTVDLQWPGPAW